MIQRCTNPRTQHFDRYGGRGISVCARWRSSFVSFLADVGARLTKEHTLERKNNDGNYEPGNVIWATRLEQQRNTRWSKHVELGGVRIPIGECARRFGVCRDTITNRLRAGFSPEQAVGLKPIEMIERLPQKTSKHKGVAWDKDRGKWIAYGKRNGRAKNLGRFEDELEAARVAKEYCGKPTGRRKLRRRYPEGFSVERSVNRTE
jgi:hypothetical protein